MTIDPLVAQTISDILGDTASSEGARAAGPGLNVAAWKALAENGLPWVGVDEAAGGEGGTLQDAADVLSICSRFPLAVPIAENGLIGGTMVTDAGLVIARDGAGPYTIAPGATGDDLHVTSTSSGWTVRGILHRVPYAGASSAVVAQIAHHGGAFVVVLPRSAYDVVAGSNLAGEPRDTISITDAKLTAESVAETPLGRLEALGAVARSVQISGALEQVLAMSVTYANERKQFGRTIASFQAVSHLLAQLAEHAATAQVASGIGVLGLVHGDDSQAAMAKSLCGRAASEGARMAHQIHGAIGVTEEYDLQLLTRRLLSWRDEFGAERRWEAAIGSSLLDRGSRDAWDVVLGRLPALSQSRVTSGATR